MSERQVYIRLDGEVGPAQRISCGLPQGSSISPILFMLYISPLFKLDRLKKTFGYADDVAILEISPTLEENSRKIGEAINQALTWGRTEGITFEPGKSELPHFSRKHCDKTNHPPIFTDEFTIFENQRNPSLKWLGIHFDRKLTFKHHVSVQAYKALKVPNALRCFGNTFRGISPQLSKQVISACVLPIAHFGSQTWWPGKIRINGGRSVCNRVGTHLKLLDKVHRAAARAILPVYRTTPSVVLYRESGLSPAELTLDTLSRRAAMRTRRLDPFHPLYIKSHKLATSHTETRLARALEKIPPSEEIDPISIPPWEKLEIISSTSIPNLNLPSSQSIRAGIFCNFLNNLSKSDILVYADGSKTLDGKTGIGYVIF